MAFTQPNTAQTIPNAIDTARSNDNALDARLVAVESANPADTANEVASARGSMADLAARLDRSIDGAGDLKLGALRGVSYRRVALSPIYVSGQTFKVAGDHSELFGSGILLEFSNTAGEQAFAETQATSYDQVADQTTVTMAGAVIMSDVSAIAIGPVSLAEQHLVSLLTALANLTLRIFDLEARLNAMEMNNG